MMQRIAETERMMNAAGQFARFEIECARAIDRAEMPAGEGEIATNRDAAILAGVRGPEGRARAIIITGERAEKTIVSADELAAIKFRDPFQKERFHEDAVVLDLLAQTAPPASARSVQSRKSPRTM